MATMILLPDGSSGHTVHWAPGGAYTHEHALSYDDGDGTYVECSGNFRQLTVTYANPSVAESAIASIISVRFLSKGRHTGRVVTADVDISFATPTAGFSETAQYLAHAISYTTINGTARITSNGSSAWTYSDLENLSLKMIKNGTNQVRMSYLALEVTYVEAAGYGNDVIGIDSGDISKINGIATADIDKVNDV
jgi:hypothetical protein